ncbi:hypothetical protein [Fimbriimonas ginsengisoli]|uniref:Uncharacterized protein n=1 Tax=Fimbriimonas ginsengisoli Gsoil 348 TaxID=661478 RepID=A0A068NQX9_FIMGI|nr:hypothetical protein [Fimbriimonas ginsengisoli]AIE85145.1 hypothetical protein OP10G_1777 [Fimbriimonas ginsengisoli Gsoil 348]
MNLEEMCRRQWRNRSAAIREVLDRRRSTLAEAAGPLTDSEKVKRDSANRMLRVQGGPGTERK